MVRIHLFAALSIVGLVHAQEAAESPTYLSGKAVLKLEGEIYRWGLKSEVGEGFVNPMPLKYKAFKEAAKAGGK